MPVEDYIIIGKFGKPHGLKGFLRVFPYSDDFTSFLGYNFFIKSGSYWHSIKYKSKMNNPSKEFLIANFDGIDTVEKATTLTNEFLYIKKESLPLLKEGEFYFDDLIGMNVWLDVKNSIESIETAEEYILLGQVEQVKKHFNQTLLIIPPTENGFLKTRLFIPFRYGETIISVNKSDNKIITNWLVL